MNNEDPPDQPRGLLDGKWFDAVLWLTVAYFAARLVIHLVSDQEVLVVPLVLLIVALAAVVLRRRRRRVPWRH